MKLLFYKLTIVLILVINISCEKKDCADASVRIYNNIGEDVYYAYGTGDYYCYPDSIMSSGEYIDISLGEIDELSMNSYLCFCYKVGAPGDYEVELIIPIDECFEEVYIE